MKGTFTLSILLCALATAASFAGEVPADDSLIAFTQQRTNAVRITSRPVKMSVATMSRCALGPSGEGTAADPHYSKFAHVYVSPQGASTMRSNAPIVFPVGTIVLKEKFADAEGEKTELFTGMLKREAGYNSDCGDWEFFTLAADAKKITSRGKLQKCMDCHTEYGRSDFITREYVYWPHQF